MGLVFGNNVNNKSNAIFGIQKNNEIKNLNTRQPSASHKRSLKPLTLRNRIFLNSLPEFNRK